MTEPSAPRVEKIATYPDLFAICRETREDGKDDGFGKRMSSSSAGTKD